MNFYLFGFHFLCILVRCCGFADANQDFLQEERELKLTDGGGSGAMTLDLCFLLDCTGSMQPWLGSVKVRSRRCPQCWSLPFSLLAHTPPLQCTSPHSAIDWY